MRHVTVFREPGRFAGWPANYGIWRWSAEIVVGFTVGAHRTVERGHAIDKRRPFMNMQARSLDGGFTWRIEDFNGKRPDGRGLSADEHMAAGLRLGEVIDERSFEAPAQPLNFAAPDLALMSARTGISRGAVSFIYASTDRCRSWDGPFRLPSFGQTGIAARTDYLLQGEHTALLFLTANKADGDEGKVICVRARAGGQSFDLLAEVGGEPSGAAISPSCPRACNCQPAAFSARAAAALATRD